MSAIGYQVKNVYDLRLVPLWFVDPKRTPYFRDALIVANTDYIATLPEGDPRHYIVAGSQTNDLKDWFVNNSPAMGISRIGCPVPDFVKEWNSAVKDLLHDLTEASFEMVVMDLLEKLQHHFKLRTDLYDIKEILTKLAVLATPDGEEFARTFKLVGSGDNCDRGDRGYHVNMLVPRNVSVTELGETTTNTTCVNTDMSHDSGNGEAVFVFVTYPSRCTKHKNMALTCVDFIVTEESARELEYRLLNMNPDACASWYNQQTYRVAKAVIPLTSVLQSNGTEIDEPLVEEEFNDDSGMRFPSSQYHTWSMDQDDAPLDKILHGRNGHVVVHSKRRRVGADRLRYSLAQQGEEELEVYEKHHFFRKFNCSYQMFARRLTQLQPGYPDSHKLTTPLTMVRAPWVIVRHSHVPTLVYQVLKKDVQECETLERPENVVDHLMPSLLYCKEKYEYLLHVRDAHATGKIISNKRRYPYGGHDDSSQRRPRHNSDSSTEYSLSSVDADNDQSIIPPLRVTFSDDTSRQQRRRRHSDSAPSTSSSSNVRTRRSTAAAGGSSIQNGVLLGSVRASTRPPRRGTSRNPANIFDS